jgi:hypothetical protein
MKMRHLRNVPVALFPLGLAVLLISCEPGLTQDPPPPPPGVEVEARGPVHEAFAQPTTSQPTQGPVITKQPPAQIDEVPPDQKPDGDSVLWIPGYWAWNDDTSDFIWVSGCWRVPPPGQRWMPGHWQQVDGGWVWVSGLWTPDGTTEVQYLPPPPPTLEQGPSTPAPDAGSIYAPGCWVYITNAYRWRPGHWIAFRPDWIWVPACYVWTPSGCLFVDGYWDHPLDQRGLLFSPIRFDLRLWAGFGRPFIPQFVVQADFLLGAMFVRLAYRHFYFGDYFEPLYERRGFVAWPDYHPIPRVFDPCFAYYRHLHVGDPRWEPALRALYTGRRSGEIPRPPRTFAKQVEVLKTYSVNKTGGVVIHKDVNLTHVQNATVLAPITRIQTTKITNLAAIGGGKPIPGRDIKLIAVGKEEHEREIKAVTQIRDIGIQRRETEAKLLHQGGIPVLHTDPPKPVKVELPKPLPVIRPVEPVRKVVPERIVPPIHEERPIPKYEPPRPLGPPKK